MSDKKTFSETYNGKPVVIMGEEWTIEVVPYDDPKMETNQCNGLCESYTKTIKIRDLNGDPKKLELYDNIDEFMRKVLRHELLHAFFHTICNQKYNEDEELVETLAHAFPKIAKIMESVEVLWG